MTHAQLVDPTLARPVLLAAARSVLGRGSPDVEDVAQEVLRRVHEHPPTLRDPARPEAYLHRAARNESITHVVRTRREHRRRSAPDADGTRLADPAPAFADAVATRLVLVTALAGLSARQRQVIVLVDLRRFTVQDAATALGISVGAAKKHRFVGLRRLRDDPALGDLAPAA